MQFQQAGSGVCLILGQQAVALSQTINQYQTNLLPANTVTSEISRKEKQKLVSPD
jgi:hypothetical protein